MRLLCSLPRLTCFVPASAHAHTCFVAAARRRFESPAAFTPSLEPLNPRISDIKELRSARPDTQSESGSEPAGDQSTSPSRRVTTTSRG